MNEFIPHLSIESLDNGNLRLENETVGDSYVVDLHPIHVRFLAERLGLIVKPAEPDAAQPTQAEMTRDIDRLQRNMLRVREHALQLQYKFANDADWGRSDLTFEMGLINGLVDLLDMAVDDFADGFTAQEPVPYAPPHPGKDKTGVSSEAVQRAPASTPAIEGVQNSRKRGVSGSVKIEAQPGPLFAGSQEQS